MRYTERTHRKEKEPGSPWHPWSHWAPQGHGLMHRSARFLILSLFKFILTSFPMYSSSFYFLLFSVHASLSMRAREGNHFSVKLHPSLISSTKEFFNRLKTNPDTTKHE